MSGKYTPGPWYVGREDENTGEIEVVSDSRPYICLVFSGAIDEVTLANARLIAAAPELLELALYVAGDNPDYGHMHGLAIAAIAKATGEQP